MGKELDLAKSRLFDVDSLGVTNIKIYPGTNRETTAERFSEEINRMLSQLEAGDYELAGAELED
jgi:hypothetical protein